MWPKGSPKRAKGSPRAGQRDPKAPKGRPEAAQGLPKESKRRPKSAQGAPKAFQRHPKEAKGSQRDNIEFTKKMLHEKYTMVIQPKRNKSLIQ